MPLALSRRFFRTSLRRCVVGASLFVIGLPVRAGRAEKSQAEAIRALQQCGATVTRDDRQPGKPVVAVYFSPTAS